MTPSQTPLQRAVAVVAYWTPADEAELDVLIHEFVRVAFLHRDKCATCRQRGPWCDALRDAFQAVLDWRARRVLLSKAAYLREVQNLLDDEQAAA